MQRSPKIAELATLLLALVLFDIAINITLLGPFMIVGLFYPAAIYLLVVKNLIANVAVARNASLVIAILTGLHWLVALASMTSKVMTPVTFIIMGAELANVLAMAYTCYQLSKLKKSQPAEGT